MIYALVGPQDQISVRSDRIDPNVQTKTGWRWLPVKIVRPTFDPETQVRVGPVTTIEALQVLDTYSVRAKTTEEIDAEKDAQVPPDASIIFRAFLNHENRTRTLEGKQPITAAQFKAALKAMV